MPLDQVTNEDIEKDGLEDKEMSFLEHLETLRWHLIRGGSLILILAIIAFLNVKFVFGVVILGPSKADFWTYQQMCALAETLNSPALCIGQNMKLININLGGQFFTHINSSLLAGLVCGFPYLFWEIWRFIRPGLYKTEQKSARGATFFVSMLFMFGVTFGYFIVAPLSINFLYNYSVGVQNTITLGNYMSFLSALVLACGILFQMPVVAYFLAVIGILTPKFMKTYRRHAFVVILVLSAIITPPDVSSQILIALPLSILYEISIRIARRVEKARLKRMQREDEKRLD